MIVRHNGIKFEEKTRWQKYLFRGGFEPGPLESIIQMYRTRTGRRDFE